MEKLPWKGKWWDKHSLIAGKGLGGKSGDHPVLGQEGNWGFFRDLGRFPGILIPFVRTIQEMGNTLGGAVVSSNPIPAL